MQVIGAIAAAGMLKALLPGGPDVASLDGRSNLGANSVPDEQTIGIAFLAECIGGFIAMYVILEVVCNPRTKAGNIGALPPAVDTSGAGLPT